jgi:hypothetical protein
MTITIAHGAVTLTPELVKDGYTADRPTGNEAHDLVGRADPDVTWGVGGLRRGTLQLVFLTETAARAAEAQHLLPGRFVFTDTTVPTAAMLYVAVDSITTRLDGPTGRWVVSVPFREVTL